MKTFFHLNRRIHLYSGLFMIPFIFVFGLSGMFFNHSSWWSDKTSTVLESAEARDLLDHYPAADELAAALLNVVTVREDWTQVEAVDTRWSRPSILRTRAGRTDHRLEVDSNASRAWLLTLPEFADAAPIAVGQVDSLNVVDDAAFVETFEAWLAARGLESGTSSVQRSAELLVDVEAEGRALRIQLDPRTGSYRVYDLDSREFSVRNFLENLHVTHRYSLQKSDPAWAWVLCADLLAALMMLWAVSGVIMWVRMPRLLAAGTAFIAASLVVFGVLAFALRELGF